MADSKPGFFKRLFSFGKPKPEETPEPVGEITAPQPEPEIVAEVAQPEPEREPEPPQAPQEQVSDLPRKPKPAAKKAPVKKRPAKTERELEPEDEFPVELEPEPQPAPTVEIAVEPAPVRQTPASGKVAIGGPRKKALTEPQPAAREGWFGRLAKGLSRSSTALTQNVASVFTKRRLDDDTLQELEDVLIQADLGLETATRITEALSAQRYGRDVSDEEVRQVMADEIEKVLDPVAQPLELDLSHKPHVILVVGVNGSGKTTTIGKLAAKLRSCRPLHIAGGRRHISCCGD